MKNFIKDKLFQKGSTTDYDKVFSYLLQFSRTVRTHLFYRTYFMVTCEIGTKTGKKY